MILSDDADRGAALFGESRRWTRLRTISLSPPDQALWRVSGGGDEVWVLEPGALGGPASFWARIILISSAPASQFDALRNLVGGEAALAGPVACLAATGRGFHGHRGRPWTASPGNLHLSVALMPAAFAARRSLVMTVLPAVAVLDAIEGASGGALPCGVKWVNDVLIEGRKVAGVLTSTQAQDEWLVSAVLGIGLNVERTPQVPATPFTPAVGCLHEFARGEALTLGQMTRGVLDAVASRFEAVLRSGPESLVRDYLRASLVVGRRVRVWEEGLDDQAPAASWPAPLAQGVVESVGQDLSLRFEGRPDPVARGRLAFEEACQAHGL
jgi:biotin-(acetyl-CoA carboxylase) ligase